MYNKMPDPDTEYYYANCKNTSRDISMFGFPVDNKERLKAWIRNADGPPSPKFLYDKPSVKQCTPKRHTMPSENTETVHTTLSKDQGSFLFPPPRPKLARKGFFKRPKQQCLKNMIKQNKNDSPQTKYLKGAVAKLMQQNKALEVKIDSLKAIVRQLVTVGENKNTLPHLQVNMQKMSNEDTEKKPETKSPTQTIEET